ncbi:DUF456 domain-containing protein [Candidatus Woesearchaeota archaeon]|nr:MAG: DUF456 domain-containing protein [Candidatus Woesearchaeota archaeon]
MPELFALIIFSTLAVIGLILAALGLPGTWTILIGAGLYNLITWNWTISPPILALLAGIALAGELLEWIVTYAVHKRAKTSKNAFLGLICGAIIGGFLLSAIPLLGTVIGICLGAIIGAYLGEFAHHKSHKRALRAAKAAVLSRAAIMGAKLLLAIIQTAIVLHAINT